MGAVGGGEEAGDVGGGGGDRRAAAVDRVATGCCGSVVGEGLLGSSTSVGAGDDDGKMATSITAVVDDSAGARSDAGSVAGQGKPNTTPWATSDTAVSATNTPDRDSERARN